MSNESLPAQTPDDRFSLQAQLRELLPRLHEFDFVERHPLAVRLLTVLPPASDAAGVRVRDYLTATIQQLKPAESVERHAAQWRQYTILHDRYVLRKSLRDIEEHLALGERQMRREHQQAIASLAALVAPVLNQSEPPAAQNAVAVAPWADAVQRLSPLPRIFGLQQLLQDIAWAAEHTLRTIPIDVRPTLHISVQPSSLSIYTDRGILHQLLLKLTQLVIQQCDAPCDIRLAGVPCDECATSTVHIRLVAPLQIHTSDDDETMRLCQSLAGLIQSPMQVQQDEQSFAIALQLPAGERLRKVLIIDDELPSAELFQSYLIGLQYETIIETNPELALAHAEAWLPDVIVLDVMMPGMDGWELLQRLRHAPALTDIPIIACSVINDIQMASALGAATFLRKPVLRAHLIDALEQVLAD